MGAVPINRWLLFLGVGIVLISMFFPYASVKQTVGNEIITESIYPSLLEIASGADLISNVKYAFLVPFFAVLILVINFIQYSSDQKSMGQFQMLFISQWALIALGIFINYFVYFKVWDNWRFLGALVSFGFIDHIFRPSIGFWGIVFGFCTIAAGLIGGIRRIRFPKKFPINLNFRMFLQKIVSYFNYGSTQNETKKYSRFPNEEKPNHFNSREDHTHVDGKPAGDPDSQQPSSRTFRVGPFVAAYIDNRTERESPKISAWLVDEKNGHVYQLKQGKNTIGSKENNDICLPDERVSNHHARIIEERDRFRQIGIVFLLIDLNSTNGTILNGKMVKNQEVIREGDIILFGGADPLRFTTEKPVSLELKKNVYPASEPEIRKETQPSQTGNQRNIKKDYGDQRQGTPAQERRLGRLPTWLIYLLITMAILFVACVIPVLIIDIANQWCNLFGNIFNSFSPGICP